MSTQQTSQDNPLADFGPNEWIVEDMYQRYLADPTSVDPAWHEFFADYKPAVEATPAETTPLTALEQPGRFVTQWFVLFSFQGLPTGGP